MSISRYIVIAMYRDVPPLVPGAACNVLYPILVFSVNEQIPSTLSATC